MQSKQQMKEFVITLLKNKIPATYYFHDYEHTLYVVDKTIEIAEHEKRSAKEIDLLSVAALWHDVGYIKTYAGHEEAGCIFAKEYLPGYGYSDHDINIICGMIMATKIPQSPKTPLEEIIADADLEYVGTGQADPMAENLFKELKSLKPELTRETWNKQQVTFLKKHSYFTRFCRENREHMKEAYIKEIQKKI